MIIAVDNGYCNPIENIRDSLFKYCSLVDKMFWFCECPRRNDRLYMLFFLEFYFFVF